MPTVDERLDAIERKLNSIIEMLMVSKPVERAPSRPQAKRPDASIGGGLPATDEEMDDRFGNGPVKRDPSQNYWTGDSYVGSKLSDCPPEYLDAVVRWKEACAHVNATMPEKQRFVPYDKKDAALARGWAIRLRAGWGANGGATKPMKPPEGSVWESAELEEDGIPF